MARVVKHPDVRRDELLDIALDLIMTRGFAATSVEQITNAVGVAKGTFYYYFASKDDLLAQLVGRFGDSMFANLSNAPLSGSGLHQLQDFLAAATSWKLERLDTTTSVIAPFLFSDGNLAVRHHIFAEWNDRTTRLLVPILQAGHDDGSFAVDDVASTAGVVMSLWLDGGMRMWDRALAAEDEPGFIDVFVRGTASLSVALERILGAPAGSLTTRVDPQLLVGVRAPFLTELNRTAPRSAERRTS